jgi:hypothetical protein
MHVTLHVGSHRHIAQLLHQQEEGGHRAETEESGGGSDVGIQTSFLAREDEDGETEAGADGGKTAETDRKGQHYFKFYKISMFFRKASVLLLNVPNCTFWSFKLLETLFCVTVCKYHMPHDLTGSCRVADPHTFDPDPDPAF